MNRRHLIPLALLLAAQSVSAADPARLVVRADQPGARVSPLLYGIFFEEINRAGDGGLLAEMVRNRSFEDAPAPEAWTLLKSGAMEGGMALDREKPRFPQNQTALRLYCESFDPDGRLAVANDGFHGLSVVQGARYDLSVYARQSFNYGGVLRATLERTNGAVLGETSLTGFNPDAWHAFSGTLTATATEPDARLVLSLTSTGTVWLDWVSLFPQDTYKGHGLRKDLMEMLAAMKPAFVRFPGGCYVEGDVMANAFRWKQTLDVPADRPGHWNLWGYRSTDGLGFHEYLQLCEDLKAAPLFVINCGMAHRDYVPMSQMSEFVQDALDALEYANGGVDTKWGAQRAARGHPAPFHLKLMQIGNENGGPRYHERYALFHDAIKARYPDVRLIANLWQGYPTNRPIDILDEHYYNTPDFFLSQTRRYDTYDRATHRIYVGEYACTRDCGEGNLMAALGEAAFMTGMERNGDHVIMASYAPLFCHPGWKRWNPNAIVFTPARAYGTPSYHVQTLFGANRGDINLPVELTTPNVAPPARAGRIGVGTWNTQAEFKDIRVERDGQVLFASDFSSGTAGWQLGDGRWTTVDGALRQTATNQPALAFAGDEKWTDGTLSLKARKLGGEEGFLIAFQARGAKEKSWWNLGGWGNREHGLEAPGLTDDRVAGRIETGRWYDVRVELKGGRVKCFLDGQLVQEAARASRPALYAVAGRADATGEIILKVVNASGEDVPARVELKGANTNRSDVPGWVLTSESPDDENTFAQPTRVAPRAIKVTAKGPQLTHRFPAHSVTVLRIPQR